MREIKFRCWDTFDNEMCRNSEESIKRMLIVRPDRYIQMQFTGLLDKNGKEIYEGDIIDNGNGGCEIYWNPSHYQWWVGYDMNEENCFHCPLPDYEGDLEIIGNIYENPELLKDI